jgi:hypothetical protein
MHVAVEHVDEPCAGWHVHGRTVTPWFCVFRRETRAADEPAAGATGL